MDARNAGSKNWKLLWEKKLQIVSFPEQQCLYNKTVEVISKCR